jgi:hypothetical protein
LHEHPKLVPVVFQPDLVMAEQPQDFAVPLSDPIEIDDKRPGDVLHRSAMKSVPTFAPKHDEIVSREEALLNRTQGPPQQLRQLGEIRRQAAGARRSHL